MIRGNEIIKNEKCVCFSSMLMIIIWLMNEMKDAYEYGKWLMKEVKREV